jgi:hypothetical protein
VDGGAVEWLDLDLEVGCGGVEPRARSQRGAHPHVLLLSRPPTRTSSMDKNKQAGVLAIFF